jgi:hypothetical protein
LETNVQTHAISGCRALIVAPRLLQGCGIDDTEVGQDRLGENVAHQAVWIGAESIREILGEHTGLRGTWSEDGRRQIPGASLAKEMLDRTCRRSLRPGPTKGEIYDAAI